MKKQILSAVLAGSMVLTMTPAAFAAEDGSPEQTPEQNTVLTMPVQTQQEPDETEKAEITDASSLAVALGGAEYANVSDNTVTLLQNVTLEKDGTFTVPESVTLLVPSGTTLGVSNISQDIVQGLFGSKGIIRVEAGGAISLPFAGEYIGGENAYYYLQSGSATLSEFSVDNGSFRVTIEEGSEAVCGKNTTLQPGNYLTSYGVGKNGGHLTVEAGATLTVTAGLRGVSSDSPSNIKVDGTLDCTDGLLSMAAKATMEIGESGKVIIGAKGFTNASLTTVFKEYTTTGKITLANGAAFVNLSENTKNPNIQNSLSATDSGTIVSLELDGDTYYYVEGYSPEEPADPSKPEVSTGEDLSNALESEEAVNITVKPSDEETPVEVTLSKPVEGQAPVIAEDKTLTVAEKATLVLADEETAKSILTSPGKLVIAPGASLKVPASMFPASAEPAMYALAATNQAVETVELVGSGEDALLKLGKDCKVTFQNSEVGSVSGTTLTLNAGEVTVNKNVTMTLDGEPINVVVDSGSKLTFGENGAMATAADSTLTVNSNGEMTLPLMSMDEMNAMQGSIVVNTGAKVQYGSFSLLGGEDAYLTLGENAKVTMNVASGALSLDAGKATVNKAVNALLAGTDGERKPLKVTIAEGTTLDVAAGGSLNIPNDGSLVVNGTANVASTLTIHSTASLTGTGIVNVNGTDATLGVKGSDSQEKHGTIDVAIALSEGGAVAIDSTRQPETVNTEKVTGGVLIKDEQGNITIGQMSGIVVLDKDGHQVTGSFSDLAAALANENAATIYLNSSQTAYTLTSDKVIKSGVEVRVMDGATLEITQAEQDFTKILTDSKGSITVEKGGKLKLPANAGQNSTWVGADDDCRIKLTSGSMTFAFDGDGTTNAGTLTLNGNAEVPSGKEAILHLNYVPIKGVVTKGSALTVNGTLRSLSGESNTGNTGKSAADLTIDGTLTVAGNGAIQMAANAGIAVNGTLAMPLLSKEEMAAIACPITVNSGANVKYSTYDVIGGTNPLLTLSSGSASLDMSKANTENGKIGLTLNGNASVTADEVVARLVAEGSGENVPFAVDVASGSNLTIPQGKTLVISKDAELAANGTVTVEGTLDVNGNTKLTGKITLSGVSSKVIFSDAAMAPDSNVTLVLTNGAQSSNITNKPDNVVVEDKNDDGGDTGGDTGGGSGGGSSGGGGSSSSSSSSGSRYSVSVSSTANGEVTVSPKSASKGKTVTITVKPDTGYELDELTVTDKDGDEISVERESDTKYTFTMPSGKVTVKATFAKVSEQPESGIAFTDVASSAYYYDAVKWAVEQGITSGITATTFGPDASCTRAQMVSFLWRANGSPKAAGANPFTDVSADAYYYDAVLWAVEKGITSGTSATTFSPNATVTRGQTVSFLHRANGSPAVSGSSPFTDVAADAYYAAAVQWAVAENITAGTSATTFSPDAACTRGQIVSFLYRDMA